MFNKKLTELDYSNIVYHSYNNIIAVAERWCDITSPVDSIYLLSYLIETIIDDVSTSLALNGIYNKHFYKTNPPFPMKYQNGEGVEVSCLTGKTVYINLPDVKVGNRYCYYYKDLSLCYVANGFYSINAGKYSKKGTVNALECDLSRLYPHIETDGIRWADAHNKKAFSKVEDFRLAALFTLGKMRYNIGRVIYNEMQNSI